MTQLAAIDHPTPGTSEENIQFTVGYQVTDHDGDTATGSLSIDVDDDTPTVASNGLSSSTTMRLTGGNPGRRLGDVDPDTANTTGTLAHSYGADGAGTTLLTAAGAMLPAGVHQALSGGGHAADDQPGSRTACGRGADGVAVEHHGRAPTR